MYSEKRVRRYFDMAREASKNSDFPQHKLGAVIIYHGAPLAVGFNSTKTSPVQKQYNEKRDHFDIEANYKHTNSLHSEMMALLKIRNLDINFEKATIYVYRETKDGVPALAKPCKACEAMIRNLGIKNVVYTTKGGWCHEYYE